MKKYRILFLMVFLMVGLLFIPNAVNADSIEIGEVVVDFDGAVPVVGEAPKDIVINSNEYEIVFQQWYEYESGQAVTTFEYGKTYYFNIYIKEKAGYEFVSPVITTKNIAWDDDYGRLIVTNPDHSYYGCVYITGDYTTGTINENVEIYGNQSIIPIIDKTPQYLDLTLEEYEIASQDWYDEDFNKVTTFEAGKMYYYIISLKHKTAYGWDGQSSIEVNNINWEATYEYSDVRGGTLYFAGTLNPVEGFEIKIESDDGVSIGQDGPLVVPKGYGRNLQIVAEDGYRITSVKVNGVEQTLPLANDELSFNNIQEDINIVVEAEQVDSEVNKIELFEESINQKFTIGTDKTIGFTLNCDSLTGKVIVDGVELNEDNGDYSWRFLEGLFPSIKLSEEYINTLKSGSHTIKFIIEGIGEAETTFTIVETVEKNPNTFDGIGSSILMGTISLIGLVGATIYLKRRNKVRAN